MVAPLAMARRAGAVLLDILIVTVLLGTIWILVSGGGAFRAGGISVSARSVDNPVLLLTLLCGARYFVRWWSPLFGVPSWQLGDIDRAASLIVSDGASWGLGLQRRRSALIIALMTLLAIAVKLAFAWRAPGFFSGDDVEIHEMSLGVLWGAHWPIWDLRSPIFPLGFIYPIQWLADAIAVPTTQVLVASGRTAVALGSSLVIPLTALAARRQAYGVGVAAAVLVTVNKLQMAFGSSELPRPVATVLIVVAFLGLRKTDALSVALAGCCLGVAASLRFSESVFIAAALATLCLQRRVMHAALCAGLALGLSAALLAMGDYMYWGSAFHSLKAIVDFTVVKGLSSRGYQQPLWYLWNLGQWTTIPVAALAVLGASRERMDAVIWTVLPIAALSLLPHKEARYLIPVIPFLALLAANGAYRFASWCDGGSTRRIGRVPVALCVLVLMSGIVHDMGHWRLPRTNDDVRFAMQALQVIPPRSAVVAEQAWRLGGRVYFRDHDLTDLDPQQLGGENYLWAHVPPGAWVILDYRSVTDPVRAGLATRGYEEASLSSAASRYGLWRPPASASVR